jgi:hypothetical protein
VTDLMCPTCKYRMGLARFSPGRRGFEERTFECATCHGTEKLSFAVVPMKPDAVGWLATERKLPSQRGRFERASGNERFFLNRPHSIGLRRKGDFRRLSCIPKKDDLPEMRTRSLLRQTRSFLVLAMFLTGRSDETEYSDQQRACIARLYSSYDAKQMSQCVNVCRSCMGGNTVTCSTSCNLKGAR